MLCRVIEDIIYLMGSIFKCRFIFFCVLLVLFSVTSRAQDNPDNGTTDNSMFTVCIDPGHPSEVSDGMTVQNGVTENHINWIFALELKEVLEDEGVNVVLTKTEEDEYVTNRERAEIANENEADLFFRIHCDTFTDPDVRGMTFYYPDRQGTWEEEIGPPEEIIPDCERAANTIHDVAMEELDGLLNDRGVRTDNETYVGNRQGGALRGSILSRVPVCLVELCFLSSPDDVDVITDDDYRREIARAVGKGIIEFVAGATS